MSYFPWHLSGNISADAEMTDCFYICLVPGHCQVSQSMASLRGHLASDSQGIFAPPRGHQWHESGTQRFEWWQCLSLPGFLCLDFLPGALGTCLTFSNSEAQI